MVNEGALSLGIAVMGPIVVLMIRSALNIAPSSRQTTVWLLLVIPLSVSVIAIDYYSLEGAILQGVLLAFALVAILDWFYYGMKPLTLL